MEIPYGLKFVTTREAAATLGVVERTILLWLKSGALKGLRQGKRWLVDPATVERHPNRRTHVPRSSAAPAVTDDALDDPGDSPAPDPRRPSAAPAAAAGELKPLDGELGEKRARRSWTFRNISVLREITLLSARVSGALASADTLPDVYVTACRLAALDAASQGAAGYHAWGESDKTRHYARAREHLAATAAMLWVCAELAPRQADALRLLAHSVEEIAPGLGGLARRASRRRD